jgi:hypothetical protein
MNWKDYWFEASVLILLAVVIGFVLSFNWGYSEQCLQYGQPKYSPNIDPSSVTSCNLTSQTTKGDTMTRQFLCGFKDNETLSVNLTADCQTYVKARTPKNA